MSEEPQVTLFEAVGGADYFVALVDAFYDIVETDEVLRPIYPDDLTLARLHTNLFLQQYWGGPTTYDERRGHPRLRMRHSPFVIRELERDAWLAAMERALDLTPMSQHLEPDGQLVARGMLSGYFDHASTAMINHP